MRVLFEEQGLSNYVGKECDALEMHFTEKIHSFFQVVGFTSPSSLLADSGLSSGTVPGPTGGYTHQIKSRTGNGTFAKVQTRK